MARINSIAERIGIAMKYGVILADCPWKFDNARMKGRSAETKYVTMSVESLRKLDVGAIAAPNCVLLLWAVPSMLEEAISVLKAWGFDYKTMMAWIKITHSSAKEIAEIEAPEVRDPFIELPEFVSPEMLRPAFGMGWWLRGCLEPILIGVRGNPKAVDDWIGLISENFSHSKKPQSIHIYGEQFSRNRLELFARSEVSGWVTVGNEIDGSTVEEFIASEKQANIGWEQWATINHGRISTE